MTQRPIVLHIYKDFWPPIMGGAEKTINLMCYAASDAYDPRVLVSNRAPRTEQTVEDGFPVTKVATFGRLLSAPFTPALAHWIRHLPADILHVHLPNPTAEMAVLAARPKTPVVLTWHSDIVRQAWALKLYGPVHRRFLERADLIMPTSPDYLETSEELRPYRSKCHVVPLAIRVDEYALSAEEEQQVAQRRTAKQSPIAISFVGRLRYYKGLHFLLEALRGLDAEAWIMGTGPEEARLKELARELAVDNRVFFLGDLTDHEVKLHLHASDIYCLPSHLRAEAFGLNQLEAMACGLPVVACRVGGVPYVNQDGESGIIVEPGNAVLLRNALAKLIGNPDLRQQMGAAAKERVKRLFDLPQLRVNLKAVYNKIRNF